MPNTHCLPSGSLGTGETPVPQFPGPSPSILTPAGSKRGVVVMMHGLSGGPLYPQPLADFHTTPIDLPVLYLTLAQDLQADGWVVIWPSLPADDYGNGQNNGLFNDVNNDTGHGSRYLSVQERWWDHVVGYVKKTYGDWPIIPMGVSFGGQAALQIAINKTSTISGYCCQVPSTLLWCAAIGSAAQFAADPKLMWTCNSVMNGLTMPQSTLTVNETISVQNPAQTGALLVSTTGFDQIVRYTSWSGSVFSGITGGNSDVNSKMFTNGAVIQSSFTSGMDISMTALNALGNGQGGSAPVGFLCWETGDPIVGFVNTQLLYNNANGAGAPVTSNAVSGGFHFMNAANVTSIMSWFTGTVDPLCPAVH